MGPGRDRRGPLAAAPGRELGPAGRARTGCRRPSPAATPSRRRAEATDWATIVTHYDALHAAQPSPVIAFNRAIAIGMRDGPEAGLAELDRVAAAPELDGYYLLPAARADFARAAGPAPPRRRRLPGGAPARSRRAGPPLPAAATGRAPAVMRAAPAR